MSTLEKAHYDRISPTAIRSSSSNTRQDKPWDSILCFQASIYPTCHVQCRCQCHKSTSRISPEYLQPAIGAFFLSYKTFPVFGSYPCDDLNCQRRQAPRLELHYYLPTWLFSRAVHFSMSWDSLTAAGATLHLRIPRIIHTSDSVWEIIRCGDLGRLRQRLSWRKNTPTDVSPTGMSLLLVSLITYTLIVNIQPPLTKGWSQYALNRGNYNIITHLMQLGCDVSAKDLRGR